jgi:hypothetical protein
MTTNVERVYPFQVLVTARSSELEQDEALRLHLSL